MAEHKALDSLQDIQIWEGEQVENSWMIYWGKKSSFSKSEGVQV